MITAEESTKRLKGHIEGALILLGALEAVTGTYPKNRAQGAHKLDSCKFLINLYKC